jgi:hypothetical protein
MRNKLISSLAGALSALPRAFCAEIGGQGSASTARTLLWTVKT